jgi:hypothetical protein
MTVFNSMQKDFTKYIEDRYKGKVWRIERSTHVDPTKESLIVRVEFHLPASEVDEIEVYRRINKVIHVIAEGDDDT